MMPNAPTLLRQFPAAPLTPVQAITARLREECGREQITTPTLAAMAGLPYKRVWGILTGRRDLYLGELFTLTKTLGLDMRDVFSAHTSGNDLPPCEMVR